MKKNLFLLIMVMAFILSFAQFNRVYCQDNNKHNEHKHKMKAQTVCPITGDKISKDVFTDYNGKRVYFCCKACIKKFAADPEKYIKHIEASGVTLENAPAAQQGDKYTCSMCGGESDKPGKCAKCGMDLVKVEPAAQQGDKYTCSMCGGESDKPGKCAKCGMDLVKVEPAQTVCPITGEAINKDVYMDYYGKRVYFCCEDCVNKFNKNPEKYIKQIESSGVILEKVSSSKDVYTCPMCGGEFDKPGKCAKCGMDLEKVDNTKNDK